MTVRARLLLTITVIGLLIAGPALYGIAKLRELRDIAAELRGRHAEAFLSLGKLQAHLVEFDRSLRRHIVIPSAENMGLVDAALTDAERELDRLHDAGYGTAIAETAAGIADIHAATLEIDSLLSTGAVEEAAARFAEVKPLIDQALVSLDPVAWAVDRMSSAAAEAAQSISSTATTMTLSALLAAVGLAAILGLAATGMLIRPLRRLQAATAAVAAGRLDAPSDLPYDRADEIGDLSRSFRTMAQRLAELDRLKAEFVSIASHELKTPINVIGGYAALFEDGIFGEISEEQREVMVAIRTQAHDLAGLANHLLDLGRVESGNFPIHLQEMELRPLFDEVELAFRALAVQKGIAFQIDIDRSVPSTITGDPQRLRQEVLGNLLSNAFKFTPTGGSISVRAHADTALYISISDSGVGIHPDLLPRIFDKYYQVRSETDDGAESAYGTPLGDGGSPAIGGSGLGLAIVREILDAHGGTINASSTPGQGTTMRIEIPLTD